MLLAALSGCVFVDANLDVDHDEAVEQLGPISEGRSWTFVRGPFEDRRSDTGRIGYKYNGYRMRTADLRSDRPVGDIIMDAIVHAAESNGHTFGEEGILVTGYVSQFWVETDMNFWSVSVISDIEVMLEFREPESLRRLYERVYTGSYTEKTQFVTNGAYERAIEGSIQALIDEIAFDEDLVYALREQ